MKKTQQVQVTVVAHAEAHAAHRLVPGGSGLGEVADSVYGIGRVGTRSLPVRAESGTQGDDCGQDSSI